MCLQSPLFVALSSQPKKHNHASVLHEKKRINHLVQNIAFTNNKKNKWLVSNKEIDCTGRQFTAARRVRSGARARRILCRDSWR